MDRLTACTSFTSTKMLLAKTRIIEMMLKTRTAFKPKKISARIGFVLGLPPISREKLEDSQARGGSILKLLMV